MPRGPGLDAPGVLHHVIVQGLARQVIFADDTDRADFVARLAALAVASASRSMPGSTPPACPSLACRGDSGDYRRGNPQLRSAVMGIAHRRSPRETVAVPVWARIATRQRRPRWRKTRNPDRSRSSQRVDALISMAMQSRPDSTTKSTSWRP